MFPAKHRALVGATYYLWDNYDLTNKREKSRDVWYNWGSMDDRHSTYWITLAHLSLDKKGHHFADDIFRCIFVNEKFHSLIKMSLEFVRKDPIDNNPALV